MGRLWDIVQAHIDAQPYGASLRSVAARLNMSPTALTNWREPKSLPDARNLRALADLTGTAYFRVLDAALEDAGYHERAGGEHARSAPNTDAGATPAAEDMVTVEATEPDPSLGLGEEASPEPSRDPRRQGRV